MSDNEKIIKNSLLYVSDLCYQNKLNWKMKNRSISISDKSKTVLGKVTFKSKTIEIEINNKIKIIKLEKSETTRSIFIRFKNKLLESLNNITIGEKKLFFEENYTRGKGVKDLKIKLLYHFLKITNNKETHLSSSQNGRCVDLIKKDSGCIRFVFDDERVEYRPYIRTPSGLTNDEKEEMDNGLNYVFIDNKKYYSDWELSEVNLKNKTVDEGFVDVLSSIRNFTKSIENKKLKKTFSEISY